MCFKSFSHGIIELASQPSLPNSKGCAFRGPVFSVASMGEMKAPSVGVSGEVVPLTSCSFWSGLKAPAVKTVELGLLSWEP